MTDPRTSMSVPAVLARWCLAAGVVGPVLFVSGFTIAGLFRSGYSPISQSISTLGVGPGAWVLNGVGMLGGLSLIVFAAGFGLAMRPVLRPTNRWTCATLLALPGLGLIIAATFTGADGPIHWLVGGGLLFLGPVVAFVATGLSLLRHDGWRAWGVATLIAGVVALLLVVVLFRGSAIARPLVPMGHGGLYERMVVIESLTWYVVLSLRLLLGTFAGQSLSRELGRTA